MKKTIFLLLLLFGAVAAYADTYPYIHIKPDDLKISKESYERTIRPSLKTMVNDFKQLLPKINPIAGRVLNLQTEIITLRVFWEKRMNGCDKNENETCVETLRTVYSYLRNIDMIMNQLDYELVSQKNPIDRALGISQDLAGLLNLSYKILHEIELILMTDELNHYPYAMIEKRVAPFLWQLFAKSQFMIGPLMPEEIKTLVDNIWFNFFREIELYAIARNDRNYLINHLGDLNIAWHTFNNIVSRGSIPAIKPYIKEITIIHYHWNSIIRLIVPNAQKSKPDISSGLP